MLSSSCFPSSIKYYRDKKKFPSLQQQWHNKLKQSMPCEREDDFDFRARSNVQCATSSVLISSECGRRWGEGKGREGERRPAGLCGSARTALALHAAAHSWAWRGLQLERGMYHIPYFVSTHSPSQFTALLMVGSKTLVQPPVGAAIWVSTAHSSFFSPSP